MDELFTTWRKCSKYISIVTQPKYLDKIKPVNIKDQNLILIKDKPKK